MADDAQAGERTEEPTPRRRESAREEGRVPKSQDLGAVTAILAGGMLLAGLGGEAIARSTGALLGKSAGRLAASPLTLDSAVLLLRDTAMDFGRAVLPATLGVAGAVLLVDLVQARGVLSAHPLVPKLEHVNPAKGFGKIFSMDALVSLLKSVAKVTLLAILTWITLRRAWPELLALGGASPGRVGHVMVDVSVRLVYVVGLAFLAVAAADYGWQWWRHEQSLKMTRQDVVREFKEQEGDPLLKSRMQSLARARVRQRMLQGVKTADVVVTNPTRLAIALRWDPTVAPAPIVVAMGQRKLAERIRELARKAGVPLVENKPVARALFATAKVGEPIPPALYAAVAEILAFVYRQRAAAGASA